MENEVKYLKLQYFGDRPVSFGGTGARVTKGGSIMISSIELRYYMRRYRDVVAITNTRTGDLVHVGASASAVAPDPGMAVVAPEVVEEVVEVVEEAPVEEVVEAPVAEALVEEAAVESEGEAVEDDIVLFEDEDADATDDIKEMLAEIAPKLADDAVAAAVAVLSKDDFGVDDLTAIKGIGKATAVKIMAQFEED